MLEKITERPLWDYLKTADKPIILYGMGDGADMIIEVLEGLGISFADIFASDTFVRGQLFHGKRVKKLSEIEKEYTDFIILMTFALHDNESLNFIKKLSSDHELYSPTVPIAGKGLFTLDFIRENEALFDKAFNLLADDLSKRAFVDVINFKISGKTDYLFRSHTDKLSVYSDILHLGDNETILDLGAYDGDTIREFLSVTDGIYKKVYAFEPDEKNFNKLKRKTEGLSDIEYFNIGAWNKKETLFFAKKGGRNSRKSDTGVAVQFDSIDNLISDNITFIKMDIEGAELKALEGAENTIKNFAPKLYVCAYHRNEDFFSIPLKIHEMNPEYKIYLRIHPYIPAWETNFYATTD